MSGRKTRTEETIWPQANDEGNDQSAQEKAICNKKATPNANSWEGISRKKEGGGGKKTSRQSARISTGRSKEQDLGGSINRDDRRWLSVVKGGVGGGSGAYSV